MNHTRPYVPRIVSDNLRFALDKFLADNDFPSLYRSYSWGNDTFDLGFPDILYLENRLREHRKSANLDIDDVRAVK